MVHGCMVYTERAEMAAVSCGTGHANAVSTPLRWIFKKTRCKKLVIYVESQSSAVSLLESGEYSDHHHHAYKRSATRLFGTCTPTSEMFILEFVMSWSHYS